MPRYSIFILCCLVILTVGCVSHPKYYRASLESRMNNKFRYNVWSTRYYCAVRDEEGRHVKDDSGYKYQKVCRDSKGNTYYQDTQTVMSALHEITENQCEKIDYDVKFIGHKDVSSFIGMTPSSCSATSYSPYSTSVYCSPGVPIYDYSTNYYFSCVPKEKKVKQKNKQPLNSEMI